MKQALWRLIHFWKAFMHQPSRTVRYAFPFVLTVTTLFLATVAAMNDGSYVKLVSSESYIEAGQSFAIDVYAVTSVPVNAVNIELLFPADKIAVTGVDVGQSVITIWTEEPTFKNGKIVMQGGTYRKGFIGEHLIASVNATAQQTGKATFLTDDVQFFAGDGSGKEVTVTNSGTETLVLQVSGEKGTLAAQITVNIYTDINGDGVVGMDDILAFMTAWGSKSTVFDFNSDGKMTFRDFAIILADSFNK